MKVLFLSQTTALGPSSRYRVYQLVAHLEKLEVECSVSPAIDDEIYRRIYLAHGGGGSRGNALVKIWHRRRADLAQVNNFDAVLVQKGVFPGLYAGFERRFAARKPLVFDFDDAVWLPRTGGNRLLRALHREGAVQDILRRAAAVIAGNEFLGQYARRFNHNVTVIPSAIDLTRYPIRPKTAGASGSAPPVIGWIGSSTTLPYLKTLRPVFENLRVIPRVIASGNPAALGFSVDFRPWGLEKEFDELAQLDIGIAPLPDTPWEHGKCGVKLLQYMACGIPVVASPVGVHNTLIRHGENGFLAATENQWIEHLRQLLDNAALRQRLGQAGRDTVGQHYDVRVAAERVASVLRAVR